MGVGVHVSVRMGVGVHVRVRVGVRVHVRVRGGSVGVAIELPSAHSGEVVVRTSSHFERPPPQQVPVYSAID